MEPAVLGLIVDSSILIEAERKGQTVTELLEHIRQTFGEVEIAVCSVTIAGLVHGIYRAQSPEICQRRREFVDELKRHLPVHLITEETAEIIGRISGEQAAQGIKLPFDDLAIGASAIENSAVATLNVRHFEKIPNLVVKRT